MVKFGEMNARQGDACVGHSRKAKRLRFLSAIFLLLAVAGLFSCGTSRISYSNGSLVVENNDHRLAQVLQELERLPAPPHISRELFDRLKSELAKKLLASNENRRYALGAPTGESNKVTDLTAEFVDGVWKLSWSGKNVGDYNADGTADISDLAVLAENFFRKIEDAQDPELFRWIDGDGSGVIDISDVAPLAEHFFSVLYGYTVLHAQTTLEQPPTDDDFSVFGGTDSNPVTRLAPEFPGQPPKFSYEVSGLDPTLVHYFRVAPVAEPNGSYGPVSNDGVIPPGSATELFVTILLPRDGQTVSGTIPIFVAWPIARDDIAGISYYVDQNLIGTVTEFPYTGEWDTTTVSDGVHSLRAIIETTAGDTAEDSITVTVDQSFVPQIPDPTQPGPYQAVKETFLMPPNAETGSLMLGSLVYYPSDDGSTISADKPFPFVVIARAEDVDVDQYSYLAEYLASHGYVVVVPNYPQSTLLPPGKTNIATRAKDLKWAAEYTLGSSFIRESPYYGWVISDFGFIGHGIGFAGIAYALLVEGFGTNIFIGLSPQENFVGGGDVIPLFSSLPPQSPYFPMFVAGAENDGLSESGKDYSAYYSAHPGPAGKFRILGGNFSYFTDSMNLAGDGTATIDRQTQQSVVTTYCAVTLGLLMKGYSTYQGYLDGSIPGYGPNDPRIDQIEGKGF